MKRLLLLLLLMLFTVLSCNADDSTSLPKQSRQPIINGKPDNNPAHQGVATLYLNIWSRSHTCTGSLISDQHILTAAHCVKDTPWTKEDDKIEPYISYMRAGFGSATLAAVGDYQIQSTHPHPLYGKSNDAAYDIAIIKLKKKVSRAHATPLFVLPPSKSFNRADVNKGKVMVEVVGFGLRDPDISSSSGLKYTIDVEVSGVCGAPDVKESARSCSIRPGYSSPWGSFYYHFVNGGACYGDSGGPVFYKTDGLEYIAGVTSAGYGDCNNTDIVTRTADFYDFIREHVPGLPAEEKEDCFNGIDDNGDGRIDCEDPYCMHELHCRPEICDNGKDENGNGLTDCEDPSCADFIGCQPEICDNGKDDNGNGLTDCEDPQCADFPSCQPEICNNGKDDNGNGLVDCEDPQCAKVIYCQKEICNNGRDDDGNGLVDCEDPACENSMYCQPEICNNGVDDNGNGLVDCEDPQCADYKLCKPEICDNGIDDNGDGLVDCEDPRCAKLNVCKEICDNGVDDNGDELADCEDPQCATSWHCALGASLGDLASSCSVSLPRKGGNGALPFGLLLLAGTVFALRRRQHAG